MMQRNHEDQDGPPERDREMRTEAEEIQAAGNDLEDDQGED